MIVVIDTNVLVSAALRDRDPQAVIEWVLAQPDWDWVVSSTILAEYTEVLARSRLGLTGALRASWRDLLAESTASSTHRCSTSRATRTTRRFSPARLPHGLTTSLPATATSQKLASCYRPPFSLWRCSRGSCAITRSDPLP